MDGLRPQAPESGMQVDRAAEDTLPGTQLPLAPAHAASEECTASADTEEQRAEHAAPADELLPAARGSDAAGPSSGCASGNSMEDHAQRGLASPQPEALLLEPPAADRASEQLSSAAVEGGGELAESSTATAAEQPLEFAGEKPLASVDHSVDHPVLAAKLEDRQAECEAGGPTEVMTGSMVPPIGEAAATVSAEDDDDGFGGSDDGFGDFEEAGSLAGAGDMPGSSGDAAGEAHTRRSSSCQVAKGHGMS